MDVRFCKPTTGDSGVDSALQRSRSRPIRTGRRYEWTGDGDTEERWRNRFSAVPFIARVIHSDGMACRDRRCSACSAGGAVELISMWVDPAVRGRGVGDAAVQAVLTGADGRDVVLGQDGPHNRPAIALYERNGFGGCRSVTRRRRRTVDATVQLTVSTQRRAVAAVVQPGTAIMCLHMS